MITLVIPGGDSHEGGPAVLWPMRPRTRTGDALLHQMRVSRSARRNSGRRAWKRTSSGHLGADRPRPARLRADGHVGARMAAAAPGPARCPAAAAAGPARWRAAA